MKPGPGVMAASALIGALLSTACSTQWEKPDGSSPLWDVDSCNSQAEARYPVKNEIAYRTKYDPFYRARCAKRKTQQDRDRCRASAAGTPVYESEIVDVNSATRARFSEACMRGKGWKPVTHYFWQ